MKKAESAPDAESYTDAEIQSCLVRLADGDASDAVLMEAARIIAQLKRQRDQALRADVGEQAEEIAKLRRLDVEYGAVETAIVMLDRDFDGDSDHPDCGARLVDAVERLARKAAAYDTVNAELARVFGQGRETGVAGVEDIAYTAFMQGVTAEPGTAGDWMNDARPRVLNAIERQKARLTEAGAKFG